MRVLPLAVSLAVITLSFGQEELQDHRPKVRRDGDRLVFHPEAGARMTFGLADFRLAELQVAGRVIEPSWGPKPGYRFQGDAASARAVNWTIDGKDIVFDIKVGDAPVPLAGTERVALARLDGVLGYERRVHVAAPMDPRRPTELESRTLDFDTSELSSAPKVKTHLDHYGYSTVSSPGVTYTVHSYEREDGERVWIFRSGLHFMNQALNPGQDPALVEVVFVEPKGTSKIEVGALIAAYVEVPEDRRVLLAKFDPKRLAAEEREKARSKVKK